jgi:hypothetical protein
MTPPIFASLTSCAHEYNSYPLRTLLDEIRDKGVSGEVNTVHSKKKHKVQK